MKTKAERFIDHVQSLLIQSRHPFEQVPAVTAMWSLLKELEQAIQEVLGGGNFFSQEILKKMAIRLNRKNSDRNNELSEREFVILVNICNGMTNNEIADKLFISPKTVEVHKSNIFRKTDVKNSAQLVIYAIRRGLIEI